MAHTLIHGASQIFDVFTGQTTATPGILPAGVNFQQTLPPLGSGVLQPGFELDPRTGQVRRKCRRRRRRLLTESDFNDLMRIATLPNKQNVAVALAKAVGRR